MSPFEQYWVPESLISSGLKPGSFEKNPEIVKSLVDRFIKPLRLENQISYKIPSALIWPMSKPIFVMKWVASSDFDNQSFDREPDKL